MNRIGARIGSILLVTLLLGGCASTVGDSTNAGTANPNEPTDQQPATQVIDNCGVTVTFDDAPQRIITIKSTTLEMLLALGLEDRVVGSAFLDGPIPENLQPANWEPNIISERVPAREVLLGFEADLIFAGWTSNLSADGTGTREDLMGFGINSYIPPMACGFGEDSDTAFTFDDIFEMLAELGDIMGVPNRAAELIAEQQAMLDTLTPVSEPVSALWYSSGEDTPFVGGGTGIPNMIMDAAGLTNINADFPEPWLSMSWEVFIESDPDVIVLVSTPWNTAEDKAKRLEAHPGASQMKAVQNGNYISVDFATTEAGVRNIEAVETIISAVNALTP